MIDDGDPGSMVTHHAQPIGDLHDVLWQPITVGTRQLDHRLVVSTHRGGNGNLMGTDDEFEQRCERPRCRRPCARRRLRAPPYRVRHASGLGDDARTQLIDGHRCDRDDQIPVG
jgi:hypothetical protein